MGLTLQYKLERFKERANNLYGSFFNYDKALYTGNKEKLEIICPIHGSFFKSPKDHLRGRACAKCSYSKRKKSLTKLLEEFKSIHTDRYDYSKVSYQGAHKNINIICKEHGSFYQASNDHLKGHGCPLCAREVSSRKKAIGNELFIERSNFIHDSSFDYTSVEYVRNSTPVEVGCPTHGRFRIRPDSHLKGVGCPECKPWGTSKSEVEMVEWLGTLTECTVNDRKILEGKEIDVLLEDYKLGVEFNGIYWHSSKFKDESFHLDKMLLAEHKGYNLIHIFSDEWDYKKEIVKSRLLNLLGKTPVKLFARKTEIKEVTPKEAIDFLSINHLQGGLGSSVKLGLYYEDKLVSLMTFGKLRKNLGQTHKEGYWELLRFCNKINATVVGGASKLFKHFINNYNPIEVVSYADRRYSKGDLYEKLGFTFVRNTIPNYFYVIGENRENRFKYRKSELVRQGFDSNKTEKQIMEERGIFRIYDCGTKVYKYYNESHSI